MPLSAALRSNLLRFVEDLLAYMTPAEKRGQLDTAVLPSNSEEPDGTMEVLLEKLRAGRLGTVVGPRSIEEARHLQRIATERTRLGIPLLFAAPIDDVEWPSPLAMAASWNPEAVEAVARQAAIKANARGVTWLATPSFDFSKLIGSQGFIGESDFLAESIRDAVVHGLSGHQVSADLDRTGHALALLRTARAEANEAATKQAGAPSPTDLPFEGKDYSDWYRGTETSSEKLDEAVRRILMAKAQLGLFRDPYKLLDEAASEIAPMYDAESIALTRKSMVLLRNEDDVLPFSEQSDTVLCVDCSGGLGNSVCAALETVDVTARKLSGLALRQEGIDDPTALFAADGMAIGIAADAASRARAVLLVVGDDDCVQGSGLPVLGQAAGALLAALVHANPQCVLLAATRRPLDPKGLPPRLKGHLQTWKPRGGFPEALGPILTGKAAPSGRLPLAVGDREQMHAYPFGHGLTYGALRHTDFTLEFGCDNVVTHVTLNNPHPHPVGETIQLYVGTPDEPRPHLRGFRHVEVPANASIEARFELGLKQLGQVESDGRLRVRAGPHTVFVGRDRMDGNRGEVDVPVDLARAISLPATLRTSPEAESGSNA